MDGGDPILERVAARRVKHRERPVVVRVLTAAAGVVVGVAGLVLVVPLPEAGLPLLLGGLGLLALEFDWAARALAWVTRRAEAVRRWFRGLTPLPKTLVVLVLIGLGGGLAYLAVTHLPF